MKKVFAMLLAAALLLALAGCGGGDTPINARIKDEIAVTTMEEFLDALGSNRTIRLDAEILVSEAEISYSGLARWEGSDLFRWENVYDGWELTIQGVKDLTIRCGPKGSLTTKPRYSFVLCFEGCEGVTLEGLTVGHTVGGVCAGGVLRFTGCKDVKIKDCDLYGCGTEGLLLEDVDGLSMEGGSIYECTSDIMTVSDSKNLAFKGCAFRDNGRDTLVQLSNVEGMLFEGCLFENNGDEMSAVFGAPWWWSDEDEENVGVTVKGCTFRNNRSDALSYLDSVAFEGCVFEDNDFYWEPPPKFIDFDYAWAISDGDWETPGTRLAAEEYTGNLESLTLAVGPGMLVPVRYEGTKKATGENGEYWANYEGISGPYWSVVEGTMPRYGALLLPEARRGDLLRFTPAEAEDNCDSASGGFDYNHGHPPAAPAEVARLEALQGGRKVLHSELLATDEKGGRVALFQYENTGEEGLLLLAYLNGDRLVVEEFTAWVDEDEGGACWRADMEPDDICLFEVVALCETGEGLVLAYWWYGAEGTAKCTMLEDGGTFAYFRPASGVWFYDHWDDEFYQGH